MTEKFPTKRERRHAERRQRAQDRKPIFRLDSCHIERDKDGYRIVVQGLGLRPAFSPPKVALGDTAVTNLAFQDDGLQFTGRVPDLSGDRTLHVDLIYVDGTCDAKGP